MKLHQTGATATRFASLRCDGRLCGGSAEVEVERVSDGGAGQKALQLILRRDGFDFITLGEHDFVSSKATGHETATQSNLYAGDGVGAKDRRNVHALLNTRVRKILLVARGRILRHGDSAREEQTQMVCGN